MPETSLDVRRTLFVKSSLGQQEISSRALGLAPLTRRMLILIDGKRSFEELEPMAGGQDLCELLQQLLDKGCIEASTVLVATALPAAAAPTPASSAGAPVQGQLRTLEMQLLPNPTTRTAKEVDMARHFMMNTVNTIFQANTRLTLLEAIHACKSVEDVRRVYPKWAETIGSSAIGAKRLPEFREKLFKVL